MSYTVYNAPGGPQTHGVQYLYDPTLSVNGIYGAFRPAFSTDQSQVSFKDSANLDAFSRLRVSQPTTLFDSKQLYDSAPLFWDDAQTSGSGTSSAHSTALAATTMSVSNATAGTRVRQTKRCFNYQPGKSSLVLLTGVLGTASTGITRRVGYFNGSNGLFFQLAGSVLSCVVRSSTSGSPVDTVVAQSAWNLDKLDGTTASRITLDVTKAQIFLIDFEWLGVGRVRFGFVIDGIVYYCHEVLNANEASAVYMSSPNLPLRYEIVNGGAGAAATLVHICTTVISEGGFEDTGLILSYDGGNTYVDADTAGTVYACIGMRLKTTHLSATVKNLGMTMMGATANDDFLWRLYSNPAVAGTFAYADLTNSAVQIATGASTNTITGGTLLNAGYVTSRTSVENALVNALNLGAKIDGTRDEVVLAVMPVAGASNLDIYSSITWRELL